MRNFFKKIRRFVQPPEALLQAIQGRVVIQFEAKGHPRVVHPHSCGNLKEGTILSCWQIGGGSSTGNLPGWRTFDLADIQNLQVTTETFEPQVTYNPHWFKFIRTYAKVG